MSHGQGVNGAGRTLVLTCVTLLLGQDRLHQGHVRCLPGSHREGEVTTVPAEGSPRHI